VPGLIRAMNKRPKTRAAAFFALALASLSLAACGQGGDEPSQTTTKATAFGGNTTTQTGNAPIPVSPRGGPLKTVLWGAQIGDQLTGTAPPYDMSAVSKFERIAGKKLAILGFASPFQDCTSGKCTFLDFAADLFERVRQHGSIPLISWASDSIPASTDQPQFQLRDVTAGRYDNYIRKWAIAARDWGHPFFLRFNWEMNGFWFPWGVGANGNRTADFVPAWRHVHDIFTSVGATNATWVWCPNIDLHKPPADLRPLYPGDKYVDWTCLDGFNWGIRSGSPGWLSFREIFGDSYRRLRQLVPDKPIMLGEMASSNSGGDKVSWIRDMLTTMPTEFPGIHAFVWLDVHDRGTNWPIETSNAVASEFRRGIARRAYLANDYGNLDTSPIPPPDQG